MTENAPITRQELETIRPLGYLEGYGVLNEEGEPRDDLAGVLASAASVQFESAEVAPQELLTVLEALRHTLAAATGSTAHDRFREGVEDAFDVAVSLLQQDVHDAIQDWVYEWQPFIDSEESIGAFLGHLQSVASLYSLAVTRKIAGE